MQYWKMLCHIVAVFVVTSLSAADAQATTYVQEEFTCQFDGEKFQIPIVESNSSKIKYPDGRNMDGASLGDYPECIENGFLLFKEHWTKEELALLEKAIKSPDFLKLREDKTAPDSYRVWWLQKQLGTDPIDLAETLLFASMEARDKAWQAAYLLADEERSFDQEEADYWRSFLPALPTYQRKFVDAVKQLPPPANVDEEDKLFWLKLGAANIMRELRDFDESKALFTKQRDNMEALSRSLSHDDKADLTHRIDEQLKLIAEKNSSDAPLNLMPTEYVAIQCGKLGKDSEGKNSQDFTASELARCQSQEVITSMLKNENYNYESQLANMAFFCSDTEAADEAAGKGIDLSKCKTAPVVRKIAEQQIALELDEIQSLQYDREYAVEHAFARCLGEKNGYIKLPEREIALCKSDIMAQESAEFANNGRAAQIEDDYKHCWDAKASKSEISDHQPDAESLVADMDNADCDELLVPIDEMELAHIESDETEEQEAKVKERERKLKQPEAHHATIWRCRYAKDGKLTLSLTEKPKCDTPAIVSELSNIEKWRQSPDMYPANPPYAYSDQALIDELNDIEAPTYPIADEVDTQSTQSVVQVTVKETAVLDEKP